MAPPTYFYLFPLGIYVGLLRTELLRAEALS